MVEMRLAGVKIGQIAQEFGYNPSYLGVMLSRGMAKQTAEKVLHTVGLPPNSHNLPASEVLKPVASVRVYNLLKNVGNPTVSELLKIPDAELLRHHNFGRASLNELRGLLSRFFGGSTECIDSKGTL
jgi:hypothetical protein